jgi:hypothetical protein
VLASVKRAGVPPFARTGLEPVGDSSSAVPRDTGDTVDMAVVDLEDIDMD